MVCQAQKQNWFCAGDEAKTLVRSGEAPVRRRSGAWEKCRSPSSLIKPEPVFVPSRDTDYTVAAAAEDEHGWLLASMSHEDKRLGQNGDGR